MGSFIASALASALAVTVTAGPTVQSQSQAKSEKKSQKSLLQAQADQVRVAEEKAQAAETLASATALEEVKKRRRAQSNTILTSPLGSTNMAQTQKARLLGG